MSYTAFIRHRLMESAITDSPQFQQWFKGSKIVDPQGNPQIVYHGTNRNYDRFDLTHRSAKTGNPNAQLGFFFTTNKDEANRYAQAWGKDGGNVMPVYLSVKNPYHMPYKEFDDLAMQVWRSLKTDPDHDPNAVLTINDVEASRKAAERLRKHEAIAQQAAHARREELIDQGYDGIIIEVQGGKIIEIVAFYPEQIKSAFAQQFNPASPMLGETSNDLSELESALILWGEGKTREAQPRLLALANIAQRFTNTQGWLYRGFMPDQKQLADLRRYGKFVIHTPADRPLSSWCNDPRAVEEFMHGWEREWVMLKKRAADLSVFIDLTEFNDAAEPHTDMGVQGEVIVVMPPQLVIAQTDLVGGVRR